eukprot:1006932-Ditylum_brightwellii.AAC.1
MDWEAGVPSSKCILENLAQIPNYSILKQIKARRVVVHGCGTRRGRRQDDEYGVANWGGTRVKRRLVEDLCIFMQCQQLNVQSRKVFARGREMVKPWQFQQKIMTAMQLEMTTKFT